ncbi:aldo/keto reductase [Amnibacterium sp. CER49]|uniref:aldo/keto reductase n=1 Tax=Amnibacterium sp. CER49 TaxID=3039161 RepID=UPI00244C2250|nr:aldo/keto reductase [Amnibacterium sp. CER49]MDH2445281.1 aldo/keto reductase [Amnibacterium sp. CER49]
MPAAPSLPLSDGAAIPQIGLGTWPLKGEDAAVAVASALELGYRHVDTAVRYGNEDGVGEGIRRSGVPREEVFVTTKLDGEFQGDDKAVGGLAGSLERLGTEYVDLLLLHWPLPARGLFVETLRTFARLQQEGKVRSIGVSNFTPAHLETLREDAGIVPVVNQIQIDPTIPRLEQRRYDEEHGIVTESWSPLGGPGAALLQDPAIVRIAEQVGRTPGQVVLRWHVQHGLVPLPKSATPSRQAENLDVFGFALGNEEMTALDALSTGPDAGVDSDVEGH